MLSEIKFLIRWKRNAIFYFWSLWRLRFEFEGKLENFHIAKTEQKTPARSSGRQTNKYMCLKNGCAFFHWYVLIGCFFSVQRSLNQFVWMRLLNNCCGVEGKMNVAKTIRKSIEFDLSKTQIIDQSREFKCLLVY